MQISHFLNHPLLYEDDAGVPFSQASSVDISGRDRFSLSRSDNSRYGVGLE